MDKNNGRENILAERHSIRRIKNCLKSNTCSRLHQESCYKKHFKIALHRCEFFPRCEDFFFLFDWVNRSFWLIVKCLRNNKSSKVEFKIDPKVIFWRRKKCEKSFSNINSSYWAKASFKCNLINTDSSVLKRVFVWTMNVEESM